MKFVTVLLVAGLTLWAQAINCSFGRLTEAKVEGLLSGGVVPPRVIKIAEACGLSFELTSAVVVRLKHAGADDALISALRGIQQQPVAPTIPPASAAIFKKLRTIHDEDWQAEVVISNGQLPVLATSRYGDDWKLRKADGVTIVTLNSPKDFWIYSVAFSPDSKILAVASNEAVHIYNMDDPTSAFRTIDLKAGSPGSLRETQISFGFDGRSMLAQSIGYYAQEGMTQLFDIESGHAHRVAENRAVCSAVSSDGGQVAVFIGTNAVIGNTQSSTPWKSIPLTRSPLTYYDCTFSLDGKHLYRVGEAREHGHDLIIAEDILATPPRVVRAVVDRPRRSCMNWSYELACGRTRCEFFEISGTELSIMDLYTGVIRRQHVASGFPECEARFSVSPDGHWMAIISWNTMDTSRGGSLLDIYERIE